VTAALAAAEQCLRDARDAVDEAYDIHDNARHKYEITAAALKSAVAARERALLAVYVAKASAAPVSA
jgi:hypothetical protein